MNKELNKTLHLVIDLISPVANTNGSPSVLLFAFSHLDPKRILLSVDQNTNEWYFLCLTPNDGWKRVVNIGMNDYKFNLFHQTIPLRRSHCLPKHNIDPAQWLHSISDDIMAIVKRMQNDEMLKTLKEFHSENIH